MKSAKSGISAHRPVCATFKGSRRPGDTHNPAERGAIIDRARDLAAAVLWHALPIFAITRRNVRRAKSGRGTKARLPAIAVTPFQLSTLVKGGRSLRDGAPDLDLLEDM
jgi:hypothetical protein